MPRCNLLLLVGLVILLLFTNDAKAQVVRVYGKVTNNRMEPLANVSIHLKTSSVGTLSRDDGNYELFISKGRYEIVVSMVGYETIILPVVVNDELLQNITLRDDDEKTTLSEVVVKVKLKDRAEEIMRKLVEKKDSINQAVKSYSFKAYIKAVQKDSAIGDKKKSGPSSTYCKTDKRNLPES